MASSARVAVPATAISQDRSLASSTAVPWYVWTAAVAVSSTIIGLYWDISWHMSIGRDTFWTPAHLAIQLGAVLTGVSCAYLILHTTFARNAAERAASVQVWRFRGPLGAFIAAWGGFAMLTSAPFDNWWHDSFGLDVRILSPPHAVLGVGIFAMGFGGLVLIAGRTNNATDDARRRLDWVVLYVSSLLLSMLVILGYEYLGDQRLMHSAIFYRVLGMVGCLVLVGVARASRRRWAATIVSAIYTGTWILALWIFPLFPAEAKLGPVFTPITHLIPLSFPLVLLPGAFVVDVVLERLAGKRKIVQAAVAGVCFFGVSLPFNWFFADFLMSPGARNWVFGMNYFGYFVRPSEYHTWWEFLSHENSRGEFWIGMIVAVLVSIICSRLGLAWGNWLRRVRR